MIVDGGTAYLSPPDTLAGLVSRAAALAPTRNALVGLDTSLTWAEVERATFGLAHSLRESGVEHGDRVGVARRKGHESFLSVHAILRAGAVVVPIDPLAPPLHARTVLADAEVRALVGDVRTIRAIDPWTAVAGELATVIATGEVDADHDSLAKPIVRWDDAITTSANCDLPTVRPDDVAYIIFTSGSTGRPKGIVHTHRSAMAYSARAVREYGLDADDRVAGMNPLHFDMSTLELYAAPLATSTVVIMAEAHLQFPAALVERSEECGVTVWYTVPFLLRNVTERGGLEQRPLPALRTVLYGGEPYPGASLRQLMDALPGRSIVNVYGPAEVNACTHHHVHDPSEVGDIVPIGRPWEGVEVRVVDDAGADVADGESGELWVSAPTVMRGYWKLDDLTSSQLQQNAGKAPWYRTGDIVNQAPDGVLVFRGRRDHQVKIRGVRLELEAIETVLTGAPGVLHAVAGPSAKGAAAVIRAVVVLERGAAPDTEELRAWCRERLPAIAIPRDIEFRMQLPSNASGKIDVAAVRRELAASTDGDSAKSTM